MKRIIILLCIAFIALLNYPCSGQFGKLKDLKENAEKAVGETGNNESTDKPEKTTSTSKTSPSSSAKSLSGSGEKNEEYKNFVYLKYRSAYTLGLYASDYGPDQLYQKALDLDYPETCKILKEKGIRNASKNDYTEVMEFKNKIPAIIENPVRSGINEYIAEAYKEKASKNIQKAILYLNEAAKYADAALLLDPSNEEGKQLQANVEKAQSDIAAEYYAKLYTSDFHKANKGKILFSSQPVSIGNEDPDQFRTMFNANDKIYGVVYLDGYAGTIQNDLSYFTHDENGGYYVDVDKGTTKLYIRITHSDAEMESSCLLMEIIPHVDKASDTEQAVKWMDQLAGLSPFTHTLEFRYVKGNVENAYATGTMELDWSEADIQGLKANAETALKNAIDNKARSAKLPVQFTWASGTFYDPGLTAEKIKTMLKQRWSNCSSITKLVIEKHSEGDEYMVYEDYGVPAYKTTRVAAHALYQGKDGWCY